jgi:hypothetical protein
MTNPLDTKNESSLPRDIALALALKTTGHGGPPGVWHMEDCWTALRANHQQPCLGRCSDTRAALEAAGVLP